MSISGWLEQRWLRHDAAYDRQVYRFMGKVIAERAVFLGFGCKAFIYSMMARYLDRPSDLPPVPVGYAIAYKMENRCAVVMAREPYRTIMAAARWWDLHRWWLEKQLIKLGMYRSPIEADYYENYRFDPPDLWGTPIRRHEKHLA